MGSNCEEAWLLTFKLMSSEWSIEDKELTQEENKVNSSGKLVKLRFAGGGGEPKCKNCI